MVSLKLSSSLHLRVLISTVIILRGSLCRPLLWNLALWACCILSWISPYLLNLGYLLVLPRFLLSAPWSGNSLVSKLWMQTVQFICFLSLRDPCSWLPSAQCLENSCLILFVFSFLIVSGGRVILCLLLHLGQKWKYVLIFKVSLRSRYYFLKCTSKKMTGRMSLKQLFDKCFPCFRSWLEARGLA